MEPAEREGEIMAKLTARARKAIPSSEFGIPSKRKYPMENRKHAANAKSRASEAVSSGRMSRSTEAKIDRKANRILGDKETTFTDLVNRYQASRRKGK